MVEIDCNILNERKDCERGSRPIETPNLTCVVKLMNRNVSSIILDNCDLLFENN